jgi:nascent polypeptide-associated complex subunit alpha
MFPGVNPKQMQGMMKKMGISQEEIDATKVTIEKSDGNRIIIENPNVSMVKMQGQETFQIIGEWHEESGELEISKQDIKTIMEKTGCTNEQAKKSLEKTQDLAESILELTE